MALLVVTQTEPRAIELNDAGASRLDYFKRLATTDAQLGEPLNFAGLAFHVQHGRGVSCRDELDWNCVVHLPLSSHSLAGIDRLLIPSLKIISDRQNISNLRESAKRVGYLDGGV
jgi:hypothetical protein